MLKFLDANKKNFSKKLESTLNMRKINQKNQSVSVKKIIEEVKKIGDKALIKYEKKFSSLKSKSNRIKFSKTEINQILKKTDKNLKKSIDIAYLRIKKFHLKQKFSSFKFKDKFKNELSYKYSPIERVGVYVPGGTASYPSTVLMNCIPAIVAGVKKFILPHPLLELQLIQQ